MANRESVSKLNPTSQSLSYPSLESLPKVIFSSARRSLSKDYNFHLQKSNLITAWNLSCLPLTRFSVSLKRNLLFLKLIFKIVYSTDHVDHINFAVYIFYTLIYKTLHFKLSSVKKLNLTKKETSECKSVKVF